MALPGDGGPTDAEVAADRELATQFSIAALTVWASLVSVYTGAAAVALAPIALAFANAAVGRLGRRRIENATDTLIEAADAADMRLADFIDKAASDDRRSELLTRALAVAQDAAWRNKRRALARALANGVVGDEVLIEEELLFVRAVDDIHEMDVRLLGRLAERVGRVVDLVQADPGLGYAAHRLLGNLQSHALIDSRSPVTPGGAMTPGPNYFITNAGRDFLTRLADDPA